jgi:hypothetical protein
MKRLSRRFYDRVPVTAHRDPSLLARIVEVHPLPGVRAGSALLRVGRRLLVIQDDAWSVVWIDPRTRALKPLAIRGDGGALSKQDKPDFEAALQMPDGTVYLFGSGSRRNRQRIVRWHAGTKSSPEIIDGRPIYTAVKRSLQLRHRPNIEGACAIGTQLRLFHRGAGARLSATVDLNLDALEGAAPKVRAHSWHDLGSVGGGALSFTDARALDKKRVLYLAVAEITEDAVTDGPVAGSAVGVLDETGARWTPLIDADGRPSLRKVEGLVLDRGGRSGWMVTDADDPNVPAELCRLKLTGPWR